MGRVVLGALAGVVVWLIAVFLLGRLLVLSWSDFAAITDWKLYTVPMLATRLGISAIASLAGGYAAAWTGKDSSRAPLVAGTLLLLVFVPYHTTIWDKFPIWYHLIFFISLPVLSVLGGRLRMD